METKALILIFLIIDINRVAGAEVPKPDQLKVNILDGEVLVHWKHPVHGPKNPQYNVQMGKYFGEWVPLASCSGISWTYCDLSGFIDDYRTGYKVRVQLVDGDKVSAWANARRFLPNNSELRPPFFTLLATSTTLTVYIHPKPVLRELFPFGLKYTIYLEERGENNKNTTAYLKDDMDKDEKTKNFTSLQWGKEYCVSILVESNGASFKSSLSSKKCLQLPEQEWFITAVSSLSILGVLAVIAIIAAFLMCYLNRPEKTPPALKSPVSGWLPLSVGEGVMEVVTDKGWFLSSYTTEVKNCLKVPETHFRAEVEDCEEEDRRNSINSGVNIDSRSAKERRRPVRQEDSGCGSMGGHESSTSSQTEYSSEDERPDVQTGRKREDSGVSLGGKLCSTNLNEKDCVAEGNYHSQRPAAVQICVCDDKDMLQPVQPDSSLAEVVTGYRAGPQSCICSGAGWCTWCHNHRLFGTEDTDQNAIVCVENQLQPSQCDLVNFHSGNITFSDYTTKAQTNIDVKDDLDTTFIQLRNTFPLLTCMPTLPPVKFGQDFNMNNTTLSLCDVQLQAD